MDDGDGACAGVVEALRIVEVAAHDVPGRGRPVRQAAQAGADGQPAPHEAGHYGGADESPGADDEDRPGHRASARAWRPISGRIRSTRERALARPNRNSSGT